MKLSENSRWEVKRQEAYGSCSTIWLGRHIKEYRYRGVPLMRWYAKPGLLEFLDHETQLAEEKSLNPKGYWRRIGSTPATIKRKYRFFAPPGVEIKGRMGRRGGCWIILDGRRVLLTHRLVVPYGGAV